MQARGVVAQDAESKKQVQAIFAKRAAASASFRAQELAAQAAKIEAHNYSLTELGAVLSTNLQVRFPRHSSNHLSPELFACSTV